MRLKIVVLVDISYNVYYAVCIDDIILDMYCTLNAAQTAVKKLAKSKDFADYIACFCDKQEKVTNKEIKCEWTS